MVIVNRNCANTGELRDLSYWRDNLFAGALIYLLPFCLIALIPGLYWIFATDQAPIAIVDLIAVAGMVLVAFVPGIDHTLRKIIFVSCIYLFSCALLYYIGLSGPGFVYLLASSVFSILIFPSAYSFAPAWINFIICLLFAGAVFFKMVPLSGVHNQPAGEWIAVSSNLVFLSFLLAALIPRLFDGLQETIEKEKRLTETINIQQKDIRRALDMLQQKNNELEQFAYVASHDLKEPLRMVTNFMGLLKIKYGSQLDERALTYIAFAIDGGSRLQRMITDLLELSRAGRQDAEKLPFDLNDILDEVKQNIFKLAEESGTLIVIKTTMPVLTVHGSDIVRLFQNLLINAIKFRTAGLSPVITINAVEFESEWQISIEDNGIGIEKKMFDRIFEIFARLHSNESYEGTGMGLAVCRKIVEYHGGRIWVESPEETGCTFHFTLKK